MSPTSATVQRWGPRRRDAWGNAVTTSREPFDLLTAAGAATLRPEEPEVGQQRTDSAPGPLLNPRFGSYPAPRADRRVLADDVPALREDIAAALNLDPAVLDAVRYEHDACAKECGVQRHTIVWLPALRLPLYVEELDPNGSRYEMRVTHLRPGLAPPPNPVPLPAPVPPPMTRGPVSSGGVTYSAPTQEFMFGEGTKITLNVSYGDKAVLVPDDFALERWNGEQWDHVAALKALPAQEQALDTPAGWRMTVKLPDEVEPGWHRLRVAEVGHEPTPIHQFHYSGDPNS